MMIWLIGGLNLLTPEELLNAALYKGKGQVGITTLFVPDNGHFTKDGLFVSSNGQVRVLKDGSIEISGVRLRLVGASPKKIIPENREGKFAYFGPRKVVSHLPTYRTIRYTEAYPGIDFVFNGLRDGSLEYYFHLKAGTNPDNIILEIPNAELSIASHEVKVWKKGELVFTIKDVKAFQGTRDVAISFVKISENRIGFRVQNYDPSFPLVIDPTAILAGPNADYATHMAVDENGNVYVTGHTRDYLNFIGGYDRIHGTAVMDSLSVFVAKLSPDLGTVLANVIISGSSQDYGWQILLAGDGTLYVGVSSKSDDYAPSRTFFGSTATGNFNAAVTRLDTSLMTHLGTAIISGVDHDLFRGMALGPDGSLYVAGYTYNATNFAPSRVVHGVINNIDAFVTRLSHDLFTHIETAIIGGSSNEGCYGLAVNSSGVYIVGLTSSSDIAPSRIIWGTSGGWDAFVTKLSLDLFDHIGTVLVSGSSDEAFYDVDFDTDGNLILFGITTDPSNLSISRTIWGTPGYSDVFLTRMTSNLATHMATTVVASPDSARIKYRSMDVQGDSVYVYFKMQDPSEWGGGACTSCDVGAGGGTSDGMVVGLTTDLSTCLGKSVVTGGAWEFPYSMEVYGSDIYVTGLTQDFDSTLVSTYPPPITVFGYPWYYDGYLIKVRPRCLVGVQERSNGWGMSIVRIVSNRLEVVLRRPTYVGWDAYNGDGRLIKSNSVGYLQPGKYTFPLEIEGVKVLLVKVRVGNRIYVLKTIKR
ncbi:MAG: hypothetical protein GXO39_02250 [Thermotogae bacterium]|nr:hypothetical protein [Thermotogota bacterium]